MIRKDLSHCTSLPQFYTEIRNLHIHHHERSFVDPHDDLMKTAQNLGIPINQIVYRESGVHQGASAAAMASIGVKHMQLIDVEFRLFNPVKQLFIDHGVQMDMHECSSVCTPIEWKGKVFKTATQEVLNLPPAHIAYFDAMHVHDFVYEELQTHAYSISHYIFIHDTYKLRSPKTKQLEINPTLHKAAEKFVSESNGEWIVDYHHQVNCGYTKLKRVK